MVIKINLSNRIYYTIITISILLILGTGVYAVTGVSHSLDEIGLPSCAENQVLKYLGGAWVCGTDNTGSSLPTIINSGSKPYITNGGTAYIDMFSNHNTVSGMRFFDKQSTRLGYVYGHETGGFGLLNNLGQWALRIPKNTKNAIIPGNLNVGSLAINSREIVQNKDPSNDRVTVVCPLGKKSVGGGCNCESSWGSGYIITSVPFDNGWVCQCSRTHSQAYAICI